MLILLLLAQVASQPIILRDPFEPTSQRRLSSGCGEERFELRWTVLMGQDSRFDEFSVNGTALATSEINALNRWKGERSIEGVTAMCDPHGQRLRTRLLIRFGRAERLGLPTLESFEIIGNRLVFERRAPPQDSPARG